MKKVAPPAPPCLFASCVPGWGPPRHGTAEAVVGGSCRGTEKRAPRTDCAAGRSEEEEAATLRPMEEEEAATEEEGTQDETAMAPAQRRTTTTNVGWQ